MSLAWTAYALMSQNFLQRFQAVSVSPGLMRWRPLRLARRWASIIPKATRLTDNGATRHRLLNLPGTALVDPGPWLVEPGRDFGANVSAGMPDKRMVARV